MKSIDGDFFGVVYSGPMAFEEERGKLSWNFESVKSTFEKKKLIVVGVLLQHDGFDSIVLVFTVDISHKNIF